MSMEHNENSRLRNTVRVSIAIALLSGVLLTFNQCVVDKSQSGKLKTSLTTGGSAGDIGSDNSLPDGLTMPPINTVSNDSDNDELDVGVKSYEQIYLSMSAATGVAPNYDANLVSMYNTLAGQLPVDNDIKSFLPNNQLAVTKLASEYCQRLLEDATLRAVVWPTMNFAQGPKLLFTAANKKTIIDQSIDKFMPPLDAETRTDTYNELSSLFDALATGLDVNSATSSKTVMKGMCITTLSSAHATIL